MDKVHFSIKIMVEYMMVNGLKIRCMDKVFYEIDLGTLFYASGKPAYEG